jgi:hypothetical protein
VPLPAPVVVAAPAPEKPEIPPAQPQAELRVVPDKAKTDEAAQKKRAERDLQAQQRVRDKAALKDANRTLDDILK